MIKINMGCGWRNFGNDWTHIDAGNYDHLNYKSIINLSQFQDNSVGLIYSSHVIEYFDRTEVIPLLQEWKRILNKGGTLRIAVPNFEAIATLYSKGKIPLDRVLGPLYGRMQMSDCTIYHKTVYDFVSLKELLVELGFSKVKKYNWRKTDHAIFDDYSQAYLPHMDKENGTLISLNVECVK
tara:strand:+ start:36531 stop:37073 length:543 start_codon:yes stop_codon:yes gene_type:complete